MRNLKTKKIFDRALDSGSSNWWKNQTFTGDFEILKKWKKYTFRWFREPRLLGEQWNSTKSKKIKCV